MYFATRKLAPTHEILQVSTFRPSNYLAPALNSAAIEDVTVATEVWSRKLKK